ncbi:MAG: hypothetical protein J6T35_08870 [Bacteroidales bacterium]|nr:hypothetical protein [Bacteroidales bacterium]
MKTNYFFLAAAAALLMISCSKEELNHASGGSDPAAGRSVQSTISVSTEDLTKADFNQTEVDGPYKISWQSGDKLVVIQRQYPNTGDNPHHNNTMNEFVYDDSAFRGSIDDPQAGSYWHAFFPASQFSDWSSSANRLDATLPSAQTGAKSSFNTCYLMYKTRKAADSETPSGLDQGEPLTGVSLSFTLKGLSSVIKLNVPSELNLKSIAVSAKNESDGDVYLAGQTRIRTASGDNDLFNGNTFHGDKTRITVTPAEGNLSGDVYIFLLPDTYNSTYGYHSSARTLNMVFENADGFTYTKAVSLAADHPLQGGVLHNFGSLPSTLPFDFDFNLSMDPDNSYRLTATGPDGMTLSTRPTPTDGGYTQVTVSAPGCADKVVGVYFRIWQFKTESDFWTAALAAGISSGTAITEETVFDTNGLICTAGGGATLTTNASYMTFHRGSTSSNISPTLTLNPTYNANATIAVACASNGSVNRTLTVSYDGVQKGSVQTTNGGTGENSPAKLIVDLPSVSTSKTVTVQPSSVGQRVWRVVWMEWGENVTDPNASPEAESESLSGTQEYGI